MSDYEIRNARDEQIARLIAEFEAEFGEWDDGQ